MSLKEIRRLSHVSRHEQPLHRHPYGQLFTIESGVLGLETAQGRWVMPTGCLAWVPPGQIHGARVHGDIEGTSLYFTGGWSRTAMPAGLKVVRQTPLLCALLDALTGDDLPPRSARRGYLTVLADAFARAPAQTLFVPMPRDPRLARLATALIEMPDDGTDLDGWARRIGMTRRTMTRRFQAETGWSLGQWRQQTRLLAAMQALAAGRSVTEVALTCGYASVSSFIAMFRRYLGTTPHRFAGTVQHPAS